ncbi:hypothetical protein EC973_005350 [Apophysomyces ossiformis]|uniref:DNA repair protein rad9 n=1 Tax=Apophysomyces ossiformis TaxID=679940 RepID=A0A8H7BS88_9FUNG|nr:hypothetical protein EC973_005350 [Apophysomyces ossiformis]
MTFTYTLEALVSFSDELRIEAKKSQLVLWALNSSLTGQAIVRISPRFFERYELKRPRQKRFIVLTILNQREKTLCTIFKVNLKKADLFQSCEISLVDDRIEDNEQASVTPRLHTEFVCVDGGTMTNSMWIADSEPERPLYDKNTSCHFTVDPRLVNDYLCNFPAKVAHVLLSCTPNSANIRCYWTNASVSQPSARPINAHFTLNPSDFIDYNVPEQVRIVFSLKEFKSSLWYAERLGLPITARFARSGKPVVFTIEEAGLLIADFAITTRSQNETSVTYPPSTTDSLLSFTSVSGFSHQGNEQSWTRRTSNRQLPSFSGEPSASSSHHDATSTQPYNSEDRVDDDEPLFRKDPQQRQTSMNKRKSSTVTEPRSKIRNVQLPEVGRAATGSASLEMLEPLFYASPDRPNGEHMRKMNSDNQLFAFGSPQSSTERAPRLSRNISEKHSVRPVSVDDGESTDDGLGGHVH